VSIVFSGRYGVRFERFRCALSFDIGQTDIYFIVLSIPAKDIKGECEERFRRTWLR
jgi:hypothetical protein